MKTCRHLIFDSNIFINSFRSKDYGLRLERYFRGSFHFKICKVVLMELWAGARTQREKRQLSELEKTFPCTDFDDNHFLETGQILSQLAKRSSLEPKRHKSLTWDILIALNARDNQALLLTENVEDFRKIQKHVRFSFQSPLRVA